MTQSRLSMLVYGGYLALMGGVFLLRPNPLITFLGFAPATDVWIRILGLILIILSSYFFLAVRERVWNFFRWSCYARLGAFIAFLAFVLLQMAPPVLLLFGLFDGAAAIWTGLALRRERGRL